MGVLKYKESAPGTYYHLYNRGNQKINIFREESDRQLYLNRLVKAIKKYDFSLIAYTLELNHFHFIVKQNGEFTPSKLFASIHTSYSMIFNLKYKTVGHLFQDRFKQKIISNDDYMLNMIAYIHINSVKDHLCNLPEEYKWSSYREYAGLTSNKICDHDLIDGLNLKGKSFEDYIRMASQISPFDAFDIDED